MSNSTATYLVTGGAGFIGANFVKYLLETYRDNVRIIILDALTYAGNLKTIASELERENVIFVHGDITDADTVEKVFSIYEPDYVVNFAAESHVDRSIDHARDFMMTNVIGTQTLLEQARRTWMPDGHLTGPGKRFLQVSTDEVYGTLTRDYDTPVTLRSEDGSEHISYGSETFVEETPLSPRSPYSASKASADMITLAYGETFGLPVLITRCSNNYGPFQFPEKLIPLFINNIRTGKKLPVYGKGENVRDWLYVEDHARAIDLIFHSGKPGDTYNIGGFNEWRNIDLIRVIIKTVDKMMNRPEGFSENLITYVTDRPGHDLRYAIDSRKIQRELGWEPSLQFEEGIEKTVRWYMDNQDWSDRILSGDYRKYYDDMYGNR